LRCWDPGKVGHAIPPDRNPAVDRETSRRDIGAGLLAAAIAAGVFALCFVAATLYIAS